MDTYNYSLSDLLLFSPEIYAGLISRYNMEFWPLHLLFSLIGFVLIFLLLRPVRFQGHLVSALLIFFCGWLSFVFYFLKLSPINWVAYIYIFIFLLLILQLCWIGIWKNELSFAFRSDLRSYAGLFFMLLGILIYPCVTIYLSGFSQAETLGLFPIPTLMMMLGVLLISREQPKLVLAILPFFAGLFEGLTGLTTQQYETILILFVIVVSILLLILSKYFGKERQV